MTILRIGTERAADNAAHGFIYDVCTGLMNQVDGGKPAKA